VHVPIVMADVRYIATCHMWMIDHPILPQSCFVRLRLSHSLHVRMAADVPRFNDRVGIGSDIARAFSTVPQVLTDLSRATWSRVVLRCARETPRARMEDAPSSAKRRHHHRIERLDHAFRWTTILQDG
jgi:hypothetical protein